MNRPVFIATVISMSFILFGCVRDKGDQTKLDQRPLNQGDFPGCSMIEIKKDSHLEIRREQKVILDPVTNKIWLITTLEDSKAAGQ